ncbi:rhomboid family intramembrane serine protease [Tunicatimonas pelagia]|uniref:rhomboid family intramembrane serine protease n=1 Tax=Tunicatimonas pelagia TaxID=931531 RepID=UPI002666A01A|nr:rhomboid family intramembrane serine protease [Tunicatimonas pelagia]WKN42291.1 rhomboid family intramembrane serine protease [Tunicatimonas pelagia]
MESISSSMLVPARLVFLMWGVFFLDQLYPIDLAMFGILPRTIRGLIGIITAPMLHGSVTHLVSNTMPVLILGTVLFMFYRRVANQVFLQCYFFTGVLVWLFARTSIHIGASGLIYGLAFFLIFFGLFQRDFKSLLISIIILISYGSIFYGVLPTQSYVSWESHLLGGLVGFLNAVNTGTRRLQKY